MSVNLKTETKQRLEALVIKLHGSLYPLNEMVDIAIDGYIIRREYELEREEILLEIKNMKKKNNRGLYDE